MFWGDFCRSFLFSFVFHFAWGCFLTRDTKGTDTLALFILIFWMTLVVFLLGLTHWPLAMSHNICIGSYKLRSVQNSGTCYPSQGWLFRGELGLRPIGLSSGVPDKSSRGLGSMSQYFAQILICFMPYIFRFLDQCIANKYNLNFFYVSFANKFWIRRTRLMLTSVVQPFDSVYVKKSRAGRRIFLKRRNMWKW